MSVKLTEGTIEALDKGTDITNALLQVVNLRRMDGATATPRYRLMMSDGRHSFASFMLASQLNSLVDEGHLEIHCVCKVKKTVTNILKDGRRVVIVLEMEVVKAAKETQGKIGTPTPYVQGQAPSPQKTAQSSPTAAWAPGPPSTAPAGQTFSPRKAAPSYPTPSRASAPPSTPPQTYTSAASSSKGSVGRGKKSAEAAPTTPRGSAAKMVPIASLNPYQSKWTIRARVTNKNAVRTWSNSRGEGKLFSFEVVDESGEIRITAFNKEVDKFVSLVETGKVYYISQATLKVANKQFNPLKNDYEMSLHANSSIVPCDDSGEIPMVQCNFVPIAELENRDKDAVLDVIGVCRHVEELSRITTKTSREVSKRALHLMDASGKEVTVTLWGEEAEKFDGAGQPVVAIKAARLSDFGGRSLSAQFSSTVMVNPHIPEAFRLRGWYDNEGHGVASQSLSGQRLGGGGANTAWRTLSEVKQAELGQGEKADYFSCVATVLFTRKDSCLYQACPSADCNKKVVDQHNGLYRCEKCDRDYPDFQHRLILSANIADFGDNQWVTCFQETAEVLLGCSAETLGQLKNTNEAAFDEVFQKAGFTTHVFRNRIKMETYNDESRIKATVMDIKPVDHREYSRRLINNIKKMAA